jgi:hypothetical protein
MGALRRKMLRVNGRRTQVRRPAAEHIVLSMAVPAIVDAQTFQAV